MQIDSKIFESFGKSYIESIESAFEDLDWRNVDELYVDLKRCWKEKKSVFYFGNGGSAGNAIHIVNDYVYGIARKRGAGLDAISLSSNAAVITCLGNDISYNSIFSEQIAVHAREGDVIVALSGSGNSENIISGILEAKKRKIKTHAIVAYDGGEVKKIVDNCIHLPINDMQVAEDSQLMISHMIMQKLYQDRKSVL